jgi:hypothetical protein
MRANCFVMSVKLGELGGWIGHSDENAGLPEKQCDWRQKQAGLGSFTGARTDGNSITEPD